MEVKELYRQILGIEEPWKVSEVELDVKGERIDVQVVHDEGVRWPCPECGELLTVYDHAPERVWRHLDTCQFKTYLHARIPRVNCPGHLSIILCLIIELEVKKLLDFIGPGLYYRQWIFPFSLF